MYVVGGRAGDEKLWGGGEGGGQGVKENLHFVLHPLLFWHVKALFERIMRFGIFFVLVY